MVSLRMLLCDAILLTSLASPLAAQQLSSLKVSSSPAAPRMIFLDATVLDKAGHPVVQGLTRNDFVVTDGNKSQPILSFEEPIPRGRDAGMATRSRIVLVLDFLNSSFQDIAFIRTSVRN